MILEHLTDSGLLLICFGIAILAYTVGEIFGRYKGMREVYSEMLELALPRWNHCIDSKPVKGRAVIARCTWSFKNKLCFQLASYKNGKWYDLQGNEMKSYLPKSWCYVPMIKFKDRR